MIFRAELSQNRQFRIIFEIQASNPVRNSCKLPHGSMKKRFLALKRRAEAWNSGFNFYMTIMLTGQQQYINKYPISNNIRQILIQGLPDIFFIL